MAKLTRASEPWPSVWRLIGATGWQRGESKDIVASLRDDAFKLSILRGGIWNLARGLSMHCLKGTIKPDRERGGSRIECQVHTGIWARMIAWLAFVIVSALIPNDDTGSNLIHWQSVAELRDRLVLLCFVAGFGALIVFGFPVAVYGGDGDELLVFLRATLEASERVSQGSPSDRGHTRNSEGLWRRR